MPRPTLTVVRGDQEGFKQPRVPVFRWIVHPLLKLLARRRQSREIKVSTQNQGMPIGVVGKRETLRHSCEKKRIDRIANTATDIIANSGLGWSLNRLK